MEKRLYRSRDDRMIWGVCGGIAKYFGVDPVVVRVVAIVLLVFTAGAAIIAYILAAIIIPLENSPSREPREVIKENVQEIKQTATQFGEDVRSTLSQPSSPGADVAGDRQRTRNLLGIVLIAGGIVLLLIVFLSSFRFFWWFNWKYLWPILLIALGLIVIFSARRR